MKVSVIIPCYNVENFIDRCLASLTSQSLGIQNLELICVDDCSTDGTYEKLLAWEQKYPEQMIVVQMSENSRQGAARNAGLVYATAPYVAYIDSDDWVHPQYLEILYRVAEKEQVPMVTSGHVRDFGDGKVQDAAIDLTKLAWRRVDIDSEEKRSHKISITGVDPMVWGRLLRRDFLLENGLSFPEGLAYEDNYWCVLLSGCIPAYCTVTEPLYHYFVNEKSTILAVNQPYHVDFLTVQLLSLEEMTRRGWRDRYPDAVEFHFLHSCCLDFLKIICLRYDPPSYSLFRFLQATVSEHISIPVEQNAYYDTGFTEFQKMVLTLMGKDLSKAEFAELAELVKKKGL